jgi:hypothetical protein
MVISALQLEDQHARLLVDHAEQGYPGGERTFVDYTAQAVELIDGRTARSTNPNPRRGDRRFPLHPGLRLGDRRRSAWHNPPNQADALKT